MRQDQRDAKRKAWEERVLLWKIKQIAKIIKEVAKKPEKEDV